MFHVSSIYSTKKVPCIYFLFNNKKEIMYIGTTLNLHRRLLEHIKNKNFEYYRYNIIYDSANRILMEGVLIHRIYPCLNWQKRPIEVDEDNYDKEKYGKLGRWLHLRDT